MNLGHKIMTKLLDFVFLFEVLIGIIFILGFFTKVTHKNTNTKIPLFNIIYINIIMTKAEIKEKIELKIKDTIRMKAKKINFNNKKEARKFLKNEYKAIPNRIKSLEEIFNFKGDYSFEWSFSADINVENNENKIKTVK